MLFQKPRAGMPVIGPDMDHFRIINVLHLNETVGAVDHAAAVRQGIDRRIHGGGFSVFVAERYAVLPVHAGLCQNADAVDGCDIVPQDHGSEIQGIDRQVEEGPARQLRPDDALMFMDAVAEIRGDREDLADGTAFDQVVDYFPGGQVPGPDGFRQKESLFLAQSDHFPRLGFIHRKSFFTQHMLPGLQRFKSPAAVVGVGEGNIDQFHFRVRQQFLIGAVGFSEAVLLCIGPGPFRVPRRDGCAFHLRHFPDGPCHSAGNAAGPDDSEFQHDAPSCFFVSIVNGKAPLRYCSANL